MEPERLFKQKIYNRLLKWKKESNGKSALLIEGARRIGKSTIVKSFARNEYESFILIDFTKCSQEVKNLFNDVSDLNYIFLRLQLTYGVKLVERKSLIIFDEVQFQPLARQAIKSFVEDHRYDYIETGSLISIRKNTEHILIPSEEERISMHPMDYEEFRWAMGDTATIPLLREVWEHPQPLKEAHRKLMRDFRLYMLVGDNGLFVTLAFRDKAFTENVIYERLLSDKLATNLGYLYENIVAQMLTASGNKLYYHSWPTESGKHNYAVDFLLSRGTKILPIEVKSSSYKTHASLDAFCKKYSSRITNERYLVYTKDYDREESVKYLPAYMAYFL